MARVLLINPPYPFWEGVPVSLSLTYLAAVLQEDDVEVEILDLLTSAYSPAKVKKKVRKMDPDLIGATSVTRTYPKSLKILKYCKKANSEIPTVIGGPHVTFAAEETLEEAPWIDFVVLGEGENTLRDLVRTVENGEEFKSVNGIAYRDDEGIMYTGSREPIQDLDELPFPSRKLLPLSKYRALGSRCDVITSRGCPFGCIFCVAPKMFGRKVRFRDPELVVDEIEEILDLGFQINLSDDTFTLNHDHVYGILDEILVRGVDIAWTANARVDTVNRDLLKRMKDAGCKTVFYGVESGNPEVLEKSGKGITLEQVKEAVDIANDVGMGVITSYIFGLPGETSESLRQTLEFADNLNADYTIHILAPLPGTLLYEKRDEYGIRILSKDWEKINADEPVTETITENEVVGPEELKKAMKDYLRKSDESREETFIAAEAGDKSSQEEVDRWNTLEFLTPLIQKDLVERKGRIELEGEKEPNLGESIDLFKEKIIDYFDKRPFSFEHELKKQINEGNITTEITEKGNNTNLRWKWTEI